MDGTVIPNVSTEINEVGIFRLVLGTIHFVCADVIHAIGCLDTVKVVSVVPSLVIIIINLILKQFRHIDEVDTVAQDGKGGTGIAGTVDGLGITEINLRQTINRLVILERSTKSAAIIHHGGYRGVLHDVTSLAVSGLEDGGSGVHTGITHSFIVFHIAGHLGSTGELGFGKVLRFAEAEICLRGSNLTRAEIGSHGDVTRSSCVSGIVLATRCGVRRMDVETINLGFAAQHLTERAVGCRRNDGDVLTRIE